MRLEEYTRNGEMLIQCSPLDVTYIAKILYTFVYFFAYEIQMR